MISLPVLGSQGPGLTRDGYPGAGLGTEETLWGLRAGVGPRALWFEMPCSAECVQR